MSAPPILATRGLTVRFGEKTVLEALDVEVRANEVVFFMGGSGCGKTTLLKCMVGLLAPGEGEVLFEGRPLEREGGPVRDALHRSIGMVFQGGALLSSVTLEENVALPIRARLRLPGEVIREAVRMRLAQVGLLDAAGLVPGQLSGGMRKRAGIARALALEPRLLILDEPTGGLDPITAGEIDALVEELREATGATVVVVSHDLDSAERLADRVVLMARGGVLAEGTFEELRASRDEGVRTFLEREARPEAAPEVEDWEGAA